MSQQARRTNRRVSNSSPKQKLIGHGLREIVLIFFCFIGLYLFVSLVTYYPGDPGISHRGQVEEIRNKGGLAGALFADLFFLWFGYFAYLFPIMVGYIGWLLYQGKHHDILAEPRALVIPGIGFILTLIAGCGLAIVHFSAESVLLPSHAGGLLGTWVGNSLVSLVDPLGATLIFLAMFFTGITLLTGLSWLRLMDILGYHTLQWLPIVKKYTSRHFIPWFMRHTRAWLNVITHLLKMVYRQLQKGGNVAYRRWQTRRAEWRKEREQYDDDEQYYEDDEYFTKNPPPPAEETAAPQVTSLETPKIKLPTESLRPDLNLFNPLPHPPPSLNEEELSQSLIEAFKIIQIEIEVTKVYPGPVLTGFEVQTITPINTHHLDELNQALAQVLRIDHVWSVETHPGILTVEVPLLERKTIYLSELLQTPTYQDSPSALTIALGQDLSGHPVIINLVSIPHILIAGSYPQEKIGALHTFILSLLYKSSPLSLRLIFVDIHQELTLYADLPHLLRPLITQLGDISKILQWCAEEVDRRYRLMAKRGVRNIENYNQSLTPEDNTLPLPYIVFIIAEIAEMMTPPIGEKIEEWITQLAPKSRAAGLHLILATHYPSINVITGLLKANIANRIAFQVTNKNESRVILGQMGAENLLGQGDLLYLSAGAGMPIRVHGGLVTDREVQRIVADLKARATADYLLFEEEKVLAPSVVEDN